MGVSRLLGLKLLLIIRLAGVLMIVGVCLKTAAMTCLVAVQLVRNYRPKVVAEPFDSNWRFVLVAVSDLRY